MMPLFFKMATCNIGGRERRRAAMFSLPARKGFTLIELMIVVALFSLLAAIAVPAFNSYKRKLENAQAVTDITKLEAEIERYRSTHIGAIPDVLTDLGITIPSDPWGQDYVYTPIEGNKVNKSMVRWDKNLKPINVDYDLYSIGPDGQSKQKITHKDSLDDIIRANGGAYVGLASDY